MSLRRIAVLAWLLAGIAAGARAQPTRGDGLVVGRVFLDRDGDGLFSEGDEGLAGVRLITDAGLEATTDPDGRYHLSLLPVGREVSAGHLLVLDRASLPAGARVRGSTRRAIPLVPLAVVVQDFAVQPATLNVAAGRGIGSAAGQEPASLSATPDGRLGTNLAGRAAPGCSLSLDGQALALGDGGQFRAPVTIKPGINTFLLGMHCPDGQLEWIAARIHWVTRKTGGDLIAPAAPSSLAVCAGPPGGELPRSTRADLVCKLAPGVELDIQGAATTAESGMVRYRLPLKPGSNRFQVRVRSETDPELTSRLEWRVSQIHLVGSLFGSLAMAYGTGNGQAGLAYGGRLSGHLEGSLPWGLKLILGGGIESDDYEGLSFSEAVLEFIEPRSDPTRIERAPDPESGPLFTGDRGRILDHNPSGSRYHLTLARKGSLLGWGAFTIDDSVDEPVGRQRRALVGAHGVLRPLEDVFEGDDPALDLRLEGFWSRPDDASGLVQHPARDEFLTTGGTLYFLGHGWLVEGSERLTVEQRDPRTGWATARRRLRRGVDYQVDWLAGRVLLTGPLDPGLLAGGAIRLHPAGGAATVLVVEYEHLDQRPDRAFDQIAGGQLTLAGKPTDGLRLSGAFGGFFSQAAGDGALRDHRLLRARAGIDAGRWLRIWGGWASSEGIDLWPSYSTDGGLSHRLSGEPAGSDGDAYEAGARLAAGPLRLGLDFRRILGGFSDATWLASSDLTQGQGSLGVRLGGGLELVGRASATWTDQVDAVDGLVGLHWRIAPALDLALEGSLESADGPDDGLAAAWLGDGQRAMAGLRLAWRTTDRLSLTAGHQQVVWQDGTGALGRDLSLSSLGAQLALDEGWTTQVEGGWGQEVGTLVRLGLVHGPPQGGTVFAHTTLSLDGDGLVAGQLSGGQSAPVGKGWTVSSTQSLYQDRGQEARGQRVGLEVPVDRHLRLKLAYERSELHRAGDARARAELLPGPFYQHGVALTEPGRRNALFGRLAYLGETVVLSASAEYRVDEQHPFGSLGLLADPAPPTTHRQTVLRLAGRWNPTEGLVLGARLAWAETFGAWPESDGPGVPEGGLLEGSVGGAWRPAGLSWLRLIFRASAGSDQRPDATGLGLAGAGGLTWYSSSLALALRPVDWLQPTLVVAPWMQEYRPAGGAAADRLVGLTGMLRLGSQIWAGLGLAGELRVAHGDRWYDLTPDDPAGGPRLGAAAELFYQVEDDDLGGLRFSVGYSFSDLPDPLMSDLHAGRQGLFLRLEGML